MTDDYIATLADSYPGIDIRIQDLCAGKRVQVDNGFKDLTPFAIYTVQATGGGRLFITNEKGGPFFFDEYIEDSGGMDETHGHLYAMYDPIVVDCYRVRDTIEREAPCTSKLVVRVKMGRRVVD
jgi:hypothetical protein